MKIFCLITSLTMFFLVSQAQYNDSEYDISLRNKHYVGFDANAMLGQIIPFSTFQNGAPFASIVSRRIWGERGYRFAAGIDFNSSSFELNNFYLSFGLTRKQMLQGNIYWLKGFDVRITANDDFDDSNFIGVAPYWGVEYQVNKVFSLSTEASLDFGINPVIGEVAFQLRPPLRIQCHFFVNSR